MMRSLLWVAWLEEYDVAVQWIASGPRGTRDGRGYRATASEGVTSSRNDPVNGGLRDACNAGNLA
jgi:hypothetical protein